MRRWDIFCRVVDNLGDIGVCWRLARQLAEEFHDEVRLWVDRIDQFTLLCPAVSSAAPCQRVGAIELWHWSDPFPQVEPADVVIEAFACELPETYRTAMERRAVVPVWINLEYLSAESWVAGCHRLSSRPLGLSLPKYFFFPGFTPETGGLLREKDLLASRAAFDSAAAAEFWRNLRIPTHDEELRITLFCYENAALPEMLQEWSAGPGKVRLLTTPGSATRQVADWLGSSLAPGATHCRNCLAVQPLPYLSPAQFDRLLWASDLNFVRGEDSFVRAQWAQRPFVWQIYPQADEIHFAKLEAFLNLYLSDFPAGEMVRRCWHAWNGRGAMKPAWRELVAHRTIFEQHAADWAIQLDRTGDLANNLVRFVSDLVSP